MKKTLLILLLISAVSIFMAACTDSKENRIDLKIVEDWRETVIVKECEAKKGPGDNYQTMASLNYGEIVYVKGIYNEWSLCINVKDIGDCWVKTANLVAKANHQDYNLGIITAKEVTVGTITLYKGNLVQVLKRDKDKSCVTIRVIDVNGGKTGWIDNRDFTMAKPGVFFNQAYLKKETIIYKDPSFKAQTVGYTEAQDGTLFVFINGETDGWMSISSFGPVDGWVQKENVYIPTPMLAEEKEKALKVVQTYFEAFAKMDYNTMRTLATARHNTEVVHAGDVWGMKWAKAKKIEFFGEDGRLRFGVSVDMETVKSSAQYPSTETFFFVELIKGEDGIWRVDGYSTG